MRQFSSLRCSSLPGPPSGSSLSGPSSAFHCRDHPQFLHQTGPISPFSSPGTTISFFVCRDAYPPNSFPTYLSRFT
ncbi:hypothetical protein J6590_106502, partial [Homalodisca vitripennis]